MMGVAQKRSNTSQQIMHENLKNNGNFNNASRMAETPVLHEPLDESDSEAETDESSDVDMAQFQTGDDDLYDSDIEPARSFRNYVDVQMVLDEWPQLQERYTLLKRVGEGM
jgi:hypothetical protein